MLPVVTQRPVKDNGAAQGQCKAEDGSVEKNDLMGKRADSVQNFAANGKPACAEQCESSIRKAGSLDASQIETAGLRGDEHLAWRLVAANLVESVTYSRNFRILLEGLRYRRQLLFCPPIISVEEGNNTAVQLWDGYVERRNLPPIFLTQIANSRNELANDFRC